MDRETILVVHGESAVRAELKSHLEEWGYQVFEAENGAHAREQWQTISPNLMLLAVHLPDINSQELLTEFKARNPETPVIIMTDSETIDEAVRFFSLGAYDVAVVETPIRVERLRHVIQNALELFHLKAKLQSAGAAASAPGSLASLAQGIPSSGIALFDVERQLIEQALHATGWNKSKAARLLRITRDTLRYKVKKYHLENRTSDSPAMPVDIAS